MKFKNYSTQAVVLARKSISEADRILVLFTKDFGRIAVIAKGVRKPKSRKRGHIEVFNQIRFSATKTRGLDIMTEVEIINSFPLVRKNLKKMSLAYYFMEVVGKTTREGEKHMEVYDLLLNFLMRLEKVTELKKLRFEFINDILVTLGFWPKGKIIFDPDEVLQEVTERNMSSARVGKIISS